MINPNEFSYIFKTGVSEPPAVTLRTKLEPFHKNKSCTQTSDAIAEINRVLSADHDNCLVWPVQKVPEIRYDIHIPTAYQYLDFNLAAAPLDAKDTRSHRFLHNLHFNEELERHNIPRSSY